MARRYSSLTAVCNLFSLTCALALAAPQWNDDLPAESVAHSSNRAVGDDWRLPQDIIPIWYRVQLLPFLEGDRMFQTEGSVEIFVQCLQPTPNITVNSADISIDYQSITVNARLIKSINIWRIIK